MITILNLLQGGGNIIENIKYKRKIFCDINKELIALYKAMVNGIKIPEPYSFDKEHYDEVRKSWKSHDGKYPDWYYGYMMFIPSYNGLLFGSFAKDQTKSKDNSFRKYWEKHHLSLERTFDKIKDCEFICSDYKDLKIENALIYCDPPYKGTSSQTCFYNRSFDYEEYYNWCREQSENNKIYMSEIEMSEDFKIVWQCEYKRSLSNKEQKNISTIEKLYTL